MLGKVDTFAGIGEPGYCGDNGVANKAKLNGPAGLAIDKENNLYIAEIFNHVIRKIDSKTNIITTIAGSGDKGFDGDGGLATKAQLNGPEGVFVDQWGNLYIADTYNQRIRKVEAKTGIINTVAGCGNVGYSGDGGDACKATLDRPAGVVVDSKGNIYFNDYGNDRIRKVDVYGNISSFVGSGECGYSGDGGKADQARISDVYGLAIDNLDNLFFIDSLNFAVRKVSSDTGVISTVVGKGVAGDLVENEIIEKAFLGGLAHQKGTTGGEVPHAVEVDKDGNVFIGETGVNRIRMVDKLNNKIFTIAGTGDRGYSGDNDYALDARLCVHGLRIDSLGNLYFLDFHHHIVGKIVFDKD